MLKKFMTYDKLHQLIKKNIREIEQELNIRVNVVHHRKVMTKLFGAKGCYLGPQRSALIIPSFTAKEYPESFYILPKGGKTTIRINFDPKIYRHKTSKKKLLPLHSVALCSNSDTYCKKSGIYNALLNSIDDLYDIINNDRVD